MMKNTLDDYKKAVRNKYEIEKSGVHSDSLLNPSRAKLRKFCFELFKENPNDDDLKVFQSFFKFEFSIDCGKKLKGETDRFRPIGTFFQGETEPADIETINMAAILVNFEPRPFLKFSKTNNTTDVIIEPVVSRIPEEKTAAVTTVSPSAPISNLDVPQNAKNTNIKKILDKKLVLLLVLLGTLGVGFSIKQTFFPKKQCMEWQKDHYEIVECPEKAKGFANFDNKIPLDESLLKMRRIWACDTTTFFKDGKAVLWYYKVDDEVELYNMPGFHPVNDRPLKAITPYMVKTHFSKKNKK